VVGNRYKTPKKLAVMLLDLLEAVVVDGDTLAHLIEEHVDGGRLVVLVEGEEQSDE